MPKLHVDNAALLRLGWLVNGEAAYNVIGVLAPAGTAITQAVANNLGTAIKAAFTTRLATHYSANASLIRIFIRDIRAVDLEELRDTGAAVIGTATTDQLPRQLALMLTLRTARSGKSGRGRTYMPAMTEAESDVNGNILGAAAIAAVGFINDIGTALTSNGLTLAIVSRPAERTTIVKTTFHADGTTTMQTLSNIAARTGTVTVVTVVESRTPQWETQRRRVNLRGGTIALTGAQASQAV